MGLGSSPGDVKMKNQILTLLFNQIITIFNTKKSLESFQNIFSTFLVARAIHRAFNHVSSPSGCGDIHPIRFDLLDILTILGGFDQILTRLR